MKDKLRQLKKDAIRLAADFEDQQIYGVAEILDVVVENIEEACEEFEQYQADQE